MHTRQKLETTKVHLILNEEQKQKLRGAIKSYRQNISLAIVFALATSVSLLTLIVLCLNIHQVNPWNIVTSGAAIILIPPGLISCLKKARELKKWINQWS